LGFGGDHEEGDKKSNSGYCHEIMNFIHIVNLEFAPR